MLECQSENKKGHAHATKTSVCDISINNTEACIKTKNYRQARARPLRQRGKARPRPM